MGLPKGKETRENPRLRSEIGTCAHLPLMKKYQQHSGRRYLDKRENKRFETVGVALEGRIPCS